MFFFKYFFQFKSLFEKQRDIISKFQELKKVVNTSQMCFSKFARIMEYKSNLLQGTIHKNIMLQRERVKLLWTWP